MGREMLDQRFAGMKQALENATTRIGQRINEMLDDLNDLLDKHSRGEDSPQDFQDFMDKHGEYFRRTRRNIDELLDSLAKRAAAAQRFRNSLSADQRAELDSLAQQHSARHHCRMHSTVSTRIYKPRGPARTGPARSDSRATTRWGWARALRRWPTSASSSNLLSNCRRVTPRHDGRRRPGHAGPQLGDEAAVDARTLAELERTLMNQGFLDRGSTANGASRPRPCGSSGRPPCATSRNDCRVTTANVTRVALARQGAHRGDAAMAVRRPPNRGNVTRTLTNAVLRQAGRASPSCPCGSRWKTSRSPRPRRARRRCGVAGRHVVLDGDGERWLR